MKSKILKQHPKILTYTRIILITAIIIVLGAAAIHLINNALAAKIALLLMFALCALCV
ncbi:MAG: hypothetical protein GYA50_08810 [Eubacteriaceae bacterium]|nr:hypothetical protein [Eubacteriaceae bacterium]